MTRLLALALALLVAPASARPLFNDHPTSAGRRPARTHEEDRVIAGHRGQRETLSFRVSLYGQPRADMPLLVQVHEWGGNFQREEDLAFYAPDAYAFVMLYFQYQPSTGNEDDWWFGTQWEGELRMWAHEAVMAIVREAVDGDLVPRALPGVTVDPHRVWLFGHSIGGTGAYQLGVRHPEVFAAVHAHAGFARFTPPSGDFQGQFENDIVGREGAGVKVRGPDGRRYDARQFSDLSWWLQTVHGAAAETPFILMTHGAADDAVPIASGGDHLLPALDAQKRGFFYYRNAGGHSTDVFVRLNWLWNFRRDQSFLAFTNRRGYGLEAGETVDDRRRGINDLYALSWDPDSIVDTPQRYAVRLVGRGTADVTLRRLQRFAARAGSSVRYWIGAERGEGTPLAVGADGLITVPGASGGDLLVVVPADAPPPAAGPEAAPPAPRPVDAAPVPAVPDAARASRDAAIPAAAAGSKDDGCAQSGGGAPLAALLGLLGLWLRSRRNG